MIAAVTLFTVMTSLIKAADRVPAGQAVFFRAFFTMPRVSNAKQRVITDRYC